MDLLFVYNANSGLFNSITDLVHKKLSPETYACNLCKITYNVSMDPQWKNYIESLSENVTFLHKDEFNLQFASYKDTTLPAIFMRSGKKLSVLVNSSEINAQKNVKELIELLNKKKHEIN